MVSKPSSISPSTGLLIANIALVLVLIIQDGSEKLVSHQLNHCNTIVKSCYQNAC